MSFITQHIQSSDPSAPAAGKYTLFFKNDGAYIIDENGLVTKLDAGSIGDLSIYSGGNGLISWESNGAWPLKYVNQESTTQISWAAGRVVFVNSRPNNTLEVAFVDFEAQSNVIDSFVLTNLRTFWAVGRDGQVVQFADGITAEQKRDYVQIIVTTHSNTTQIDVLTPAPEIGYEIGNKLIDLQDGIRIINKNGGNKYLGNDDSTNRLQKTSGNCWANVGRNFATSNKSPMVPSQTALAPIVGILPDGSTPALFDAYNDGSGGTVGIPNISGEIDTTKYDDLSGTLADIPDGYWVTHRIYLEPTMNITIVVKGQVPHKGKIQALQAINRENFQPPPATEEYILRGAITFIKGAVGFSDNPDVIVSNADKFGQVIVNSLGTAGVTLGGVTYKSYPFTSQNILSGTFFAAGFYEWSSTSAVLTNISPSATLGSANVMYGAHPYIVSGGPGSVVGGGVVELIATYTSFTDQGVRTASDSEVIIADITDPTEAELNRMVECPKKAIGQVAFSLNVASGAPSSYSYEFNYALAKYEDMGNRDFMLTDFETTIFADGNDASYDAEIIKHSDQGHTFASTGFVPGNGSISSSRAECAPEANLAINQYAAFKRTGLDTLIRGSVGEGIICRVTTGSNNAVQIQPLHVGVEF